MIVLKPWDHDSEDGLLNSSMVQRSSATGFDHSSLSRRSELPPDDDDTRDLGELILALKGMTACVDTVLNVDPTRENSP